MNTVEAMPTKTLTEPPPNFPLTKQEVVKFCQKWQVTEFALFGSILRDDFSANSDVDILVTFDSQAKRSLFDLIQMRAELKQLLGRKVDVLTRKSVEQSHNWLRKQNILNSARVIYVSR
jgi:predicted nucleotidyltransferase